MTGNIGLLCATAASIGVVHTLLGPDHYIPFVALSRSRGWSLARTMVITSLCGVAHVLSSALLGVIGIGIGLAVFKLETIEGVRGSIAGWLLLALGIVYFVWGVRRAVRNRPHTHVHVHTGGAVHQHEHVHSSAHAHVHAPPYGSSRGGSTGEGEPQHNARNQGASDSVTPWALFLIFIFGPCEPLIPILMYPASQASMWGLVLVTATFGLVTIATMCTVVALGYVGLGRFNLAPLHRYTHALAGLAVLACGAAVVFGGL